MPVKRCINIGQKFGYWEVISLEAKYKQFPKGKYPTRLVHVRCTHCNITEQFLSISSLNSSNQCKKCGFKYRYKYNKQYCGNFSKSHFSQIRRDAKSRSLEFNVTQQELWDLFCKQMGECALSGIELVFATDYKDHTQTASLDRIDSSKGYVKDNVQWIHKSINLMKMNLDQEKFLALCRSITEYNLLENKFQRMTVLNQHINFK